MTRRAGDSAAIVYKSFNLCLQAIHIQFIFIPYHITVSDSDESPLYFSFLLFFSQRPPGFAPGVL